MRRLLHTLLSGYEAQGFSGTVLVAKDGRIVLHRGYGLADRERGIRNGTETLFEVASITKTFTATAILQLEAAGKLRTADLLSQHLGPFPPEKAAATIHHLATHTGGLVPDGYDLGPREDRDTFIEAVKRAPLESTPGERYRYTNAGFSTLAAIVEKKSGIPFETYVLERLAKRAGMRDVYFRGSLPPSAAARVARGYVAASEGSTEAKESTPPPYQWSTRGSGALITTVADVYRWHTALRTGRVLARAELDKMFHPWPNEGYAWHVQRDAKGRHMIHKGGGMPEYASQIVEYPEQGVVIVWASNDLRKRWRQDLNRGISAIVLE
jgi:CubicO group peptidase (beta-lactamase class C family)